jgi:hypothetical protein
MKFLQKIALLFIISINANSIELSKALIMDMSRSYGYNMGQTYVLDAIEKKYPNLKTQVFLAKNEFDLKYSRSIKEIELNFSKNMSKKQWNDYKSNIQNQIKKQFNYGNITQDEALNFIEEVKLRTKGNIESPVIETLLTFNEAYQKNPISELNDGFFQKYNSKDNPKAKGVDFTVKVPKSWKSQEANRPNIVRKFTSNNGYVIEDAFMESIMLLVYDLPSEVNSLSQQDVNDICNDLPENAVLRECKKTKLEDLPVVIQRTKLSASRLENSMSIELIQYKIFFKNKAIVIHGQVGTLNEKVSEKILLERFEKFKPIFNYVANSLVISDLYTKKNDNVVEYYTYKLFDDKFQAVFSGEPSLQEIPEELINPKEIEKSFPIKYTKELTQKQIDTLVQETISNMKNNQSYIYTDTYNQIAYSAQTLPSFLEHKNYIWSGIKKQIDEIIKDSLKNDNRTLINFSSTLDKENDTYVAIYNLNYIFDGQKVYSSTKHIYYKDKVYKWTVSYVNESNKFIFDEYQHNIKILN